MADDGDGTQPRRFERTTLLVAMIAGTVTTAGYALQIHLQAVQLHAQAELAADAAKPALTALATGLDGEVGLTATYVAVFIFIAGVAVLEVFWSRLTALTWLQLAVVLLLVVPLALLIFTSPAGRDGPAWILLPIIVIDAVGVVIIVRSRAHPPKAKTPRAPVIVS